MHLCSLAVQLATDNFSNKNILGQGGFGTVYLGLLPVQPAQQVAVKVLKKSGAHAQEEFNTELELLSRLDHKHLVSQPGVYQSARGGPLPCTVHSEVYTLYCTQCRALSKQGTVWICTTCCCASTTSTW